MPWLFDNVVMAPCSSDFILYRELCKISSYFSFLPDFCNDDFHVNIVNIKLASQFFTHMTTSFWFALLLALREREKERTVGISVRHRDVFHRLCCRLFLGLPDDPSVLGHLRIECGHYGTGLVGLLHG